MVSSGEVLFVHKIGSFEDTVLIFFIDFYVYSFIFKAGCYNSFKNIFLHMFR